MDRLCDDCPDREIAADDDVVIERYFSRVYDVT